MTDIIIRNAQDSDLNLIVDINAKEVQHTSPMDQERLQELKTYAYYLKVAEVEGKVAAFLLVMRDNTAYVNDNYDWFASRYNKFLYIDRIVVSAEFAGMKLGSLLYEDLFRFAEDQFIPYICCEYNVIPENLPSQKFHDKFGFQQVGQQWLDNRSKKVSLQIAEV